MTTTQTVRKAAVAKKPLPKPGKRQTLHEAVEATNKQFARTLARLAK